MNASDAVSRFLTSIQSALSGFSMSDGLVAVSLVLSLLSIWISRRAIKRQEQLQFEALQAHRDSDLIAWADATIDAISDAQRYARDLKNALIMGASAAERQSEVRTRLSALLDRGRLFFPNAEGPDDDDEEAAEANEAAYAGAPHAALKELYRIYRIVSNLGHQLIAPREAIQEIVAHRRRFVSEVFREVDPRRRKAALNALGRGLAKSKS